MLRAAAENRHHCKEPAMRITSVDKARAHAIAACPGKNFEWISCKAA